MPQKIGSRIYACFASILALLAITAILGYYSLEINRSALATYTDVSSGSARIQEIERGVIELLRDVTAFARNGDPKLVTEIERIKTRLIDSVAAEEQAATRPEAKAGLAEMHTLLAAYSDNFTKVVAARTSREQLFRDGMKAPGAKAHGDITTIREDATKAQKWDIAALAGQAEASLMTTQAGALSYLTFAVQEDREESENAAADFLDQVNKLYRSYPERRPQAAEAIRIATNYQMIFAQVATLTEEYNALIDGAMPKQAERFVQIAQGLRQARNEQLAEIGVNSATSIVRSQRTELVLSLLAFLGGLALASWIARSIVPPIRAITQAMTRLAGGDKAFAVPGLDRGDEIGEMARALSVFRENIIKNEELEAAANAQRDHFLERAKKRDQLTADFEVMIRQVITKMTSTVEHVHQSSEGLQAAAEQTGQKNFAMAAASEQATANVETVAGAAAQLGDSIQEISRRINETTRVAQESVEGVQTADGLITGLAAAAHKIGEIISLINHIAAQTNLLALNATIEAARAGEAGKGFAVVANEVKHLASQTAKATSEISDQIADIQGATGNVVEAIKIVSGSMDRVNQVVASIATAVEEQNSTTQEIVRNIREAADGNQEMTRDIAAVSQSAMETGQMTRQMVSVAEELRQVGTNLDKSVEAFLGDMRSA